MKLLGLPVQGFTILGSFWQDLEHKAFHDTSIACEGSTVATRAVEIELHLFIIL